MDIDTIEVPPIQRLRWNQYMWDGEIKLPSWAGFQIRRGNYGAASSDQVSDGSALLSLKSQDNKPEPPTAEQISAFRYLLDHESHIAAAVLQAIFEKYPEDKDAYLGAYDNEDEVELPDLLEPADLCTLIGLSHVHVLFQAHKGAAYIGFEFGCVWEEEHGLGVMTHQGRIVKVGGADTSFLWWIADRDSKSSR